MIHSFHFLKCLPKSKLDLPWGKVKTEGIDKILPKVAQKMSDEKLGQI